MQFIENRVEGREGRDGGGKERKRGRERDRKLSPQRKQQKGSERE